MSHGRGQRRPIREKERVFAGGATGALGQPRVRRLSEDGREVVGLTRHGSKSPPISYLAAEPGVADAFDDAALSTPVLAARPDEWSTPSPPFPGAGRFGP
jgi:nucleoside-diphosphate-sugar epimerase